MKRKPQLLLTCLAAFGLVGGLQAANVVTPIDATAGSSLRAESPISATIDGTGLNSTTGDISTWTHDVNDPKGNYWLSAQHAGKNGGEFITFDLGDTYEVSELYLWQYTLSDSTNRQIVDATLTFSTDNVTFSNSIAWQPTLVNTTTAYTPETFTFSETVSGVRYINMVVENNSDYVGLAEIRFGVVPEPSSFALLAGCFGLAWVMMRRR